jgi:hypothetical protein
MLASVGRQNVDTCTIVDSGDRDPALRERVAEVVSRWQALLESIVAKGSLFMNQKHVSPWAILAVMSLAVFAVMLDALVLFVAFPSIERSFSAVSSAELSWVLNAYTIVYGALLVPAGHKRAKRESAEPGDRASAAARRPGSRAGTAADWV